MAWYYNERGIRHRYSEDGHIDLCDWLADHGASRANSLDALARLIGLPGKIGIDGSQVHDLYKQGKIEEIRNYCLADVAQTALLFLRFRLLQGVLDSGQYRDAVAGLTEQLAQDTRLGALTSAIDASRLLSAA
jgi:predicted PolB exonuclease-like 3'-5' exonuclease